MVYVHALKLSKTIAVGTVVTAWYANSGLGVIDYIVVTESLYIYLSFFFLYVRE